MDDGVRGIVPARWSLPALPIKYEQFVILDWLAVEIPAGKPLPALEQLSHWRNREVHNYIQNYDWTVRMYENGGWW